MCEFLLSRKFKVVCFDNLKQGSLNNIKLLKKYRNFKFYKIDLLDKKKLSKIKLRNIYGIFHFAGIGDIVPAIERPTQYIENNALGTLNILEYARNNKILKFTYAASSSCYGLAKKIPISEDCEIDIQHPYALSKYLGEQLVLHWNKVYKMKTDVLLHFHFFSTLTLSRRYLFSSMEIQVLLHFHIFFNFNLISALPILIDEHTKHFLHLLDHKIASYLFSLYLGTNSLQFPFFE